MADILFMAENDIPHFVDSLPVHITLRLNPPHTTIEDNLIFLDEGYTYAILGEITVEHFLKKVKTLYVKTAIYAIQADAATVGVLVLGLNSEKTLNVYIYLHADYRHLGITDVILHSLIDAAAKLKETLIFEIEEKNTKALHSFSRVFRNIQPTYIDSTEQYVWVLKPEDGIPTTSSNRWIIEELSWGISHVVDKFK